MKTSTKIGIIGSIASIAAFLGLGVSADLPVTQPSSASSTATKDFTSGVALTATEACVVRADANGSTVSCGSSKSGTAVTATSNEKNPASSTKAQ